MQAIRSTSLTFAAALFCGAIWAGDMTDAASAPHSSASAASSGTAHDDQGIRQACEADMQKFCADDAHNPFRLPGCMRDHAQVLSGRCKDALVAAGKIPR